MFHSSFWCQKGVFYYVPVSQIESTVKASMLDLKNSFSGHKMLLFLLCQIGVCLPFENGSAIEKRIIGVRYSKREHKYEFHHCWWAALYGFLLTVLSICDTALCTILMLKSFYSLGSDWVSSLLLELMCSMTVREKKKLLSCQRWQIEWEEE